MRAVIVLKSRYLGSNVEVLWVGVRGSMCSI